MDKKTLRKAMLDKRRSMEEAVCEDISIRVCEKLLKTHEIKNATDICLYMPISNEVDVTYLMDVLRDMGKNIWLPKTIDNNMDFYIYEEDTPLKLGAFNIYEPESDNTLVPDDKTLIVAPGVAFTKDGMRLGYGGGFYDRYFAKYPSCIKLGVCYAFQIVDEIPVEDTDIRLDKIIYSL